MQRAGTGQLSVSLRFLYDGINSKKKIYFRRKTLEKPYKAFCGIFFLATLGHLRTNW